MNDEAYRHSEKPENQAGLLRRFSDYSESQMRGSSAMRLRLGGRNDSGIHSSPLAGEDVAERQVRGKIDEGAALWCAADVVSPPHPSPIGEGAEFLPQPGEARRGSGLKAAFTLAEVLITLGIIGIVAAMTLPTVISKYKKAEVETKLKRFYSMANQAIQLAEVQYGPKTEWNFDTEACITDAYSEQCLTEFFEKYLKKNFKYTKTEYLNNHLYIYLTDGSLLKLGWQGQDWGYVINAKDKHPVSGKTSFLFGFYPNYKWQGIPLLYKHFKNKGVEPYLHATWDGNMDTIYNRTENYAYAIQQNNWKIPDDYPLKF